tara:strand:- start:746 stop:1021 length:276 start_codon:yes stop_codon:yes gene_type:complete
MDLNKLIDKHIDKVTGHIKKNSKSNPITSKKEFFNVLKVWKMYNRDKTGVLIADESFGQSPHLWLSIFGKFIISHIEENIFPESIRRVKIT